MDARHILEQCIWRASGIYDLYYKCPHEPRVIKATDDLWVCDDTFHTADTDHWIEYKVSMDCECSFVKCLITFPYEYNQRVELATLKFLNSLNQNASPANAYVNFELMRIQVGSFSSFVGLIGHEDYDPTVAIHEMTVNNLVSAFGVVYDHWKEIRDVLSQIT